MVRKLKPAHCASLQVQLVEGDVEEEVGEQGVAPKVAGEGGEPLGGGCQAPIIDSCVDCSPSKLAHVLPTTLILCRRGGCWGCCRVH